MLAGGHLPGLPMQEQRPYQSAVPEMVNLGPELPPSLQISCAAKTDAEIRDFAMSEVAPWGCF